MKTTLLITTWGRAAQLEKSLVSIANRTMPDEIIIVDDGTEDDSVYKVCDEFSLTYTNFEIKYITLNNPGHTLCCKARNAGLKVATGDLMIVSEPEMEFVTDVVAQMKQYAEENTKLCINAGTVHHVKAGPRIETTTDWIAPFTCSYQRQWLLDIGGWDEAMPGVWGYDDVDLLTRLRISGHQQAIATEIEVTHQMHDPCPTNAHAAAELNYAHFRSKSFVVNGEGDLTDLVANK